jgi:NAD(P)-dependent dehydrogenase (short-subunit alcohol dehydrogenase family)
MVYVDSGLNGKHVLITGASGGIGLEMTRVFLDEGAKVTANYNQSPRGLSALMTDYPTCLTTVGADVSSVEAMSNLFRKANSAFGRVDVAVANAGVANYEGVSAQEMSLDQWERILRVNLSGAFLTAKYFFQNLEEYPGEDASLVLIGSTAGLFGEAWYSDYSSSKAAMHGLMMSLKNEIVHIAERGRVNIVNPGWTLTPMAKEAVADKIMLSRILQTIPLRKIALPTDIANAVLYLSSDRLAGHVSGQTITVAGGMEGRVLFTPDEVDDYASRY